MSGGDNSYGGRSGMGAIMKLGGVPPWLICARSAYWLRNIDATSRVKNSWLKIVFIKLAYYLISVLM
jgi:hypothetical protein